MINGFDMYVYGASLFQLGPYSAISEDLSTVDTIQGREDTQSRCSNDPFERLEWQKRLSYSTCFAVRDETAYQASRSGRKLLAHENANLETSSPDMEPYADLDARVYTWAPGGELGDWFVIQIPTIIFAVELFVRGAEAAPSTAISNEVPPAYNTTYIPEHLQVRYSPTISLLRTTKLDCCFLLLFCWVHI